MVKCSCGDCAYCRKLYRSRYISSLRHERLMFINSLSTDELLSFVRRGEL